MKPKVYVETSVIGYLTSWPSGDPAFWAAVIAAVVLFWSTMTRAPDRAA